MKIQKGFTLIELLVVISVISLLASIILSSLGSARAKSRDAKRMRDIQEINTAIQLYILDNGQSPLVNESGYTQARDTFQVEWNALASALSPYIKSLPKDPCSSCTSYDGQYKDASWSDGGMVHLLRYTYVSGRRLVNIGASNSLSDYQLFPSGFEQRSLNNFGFMTSVY